jgi:ribosome-associated translation inhibitor RaiA
MGKCEVLLHLEENNKSEHCLIQAKIELPQKTLFASNKANSFERALSGVIEALQHQLNHYKEERSPKH